MKTFRKIVALVLVLVMSVISPMQILAASQPQYISEIRIGYGAEGKAALEQEGFTVWQNLNANEGGSGSEVWLGYTTTANPDEAITDVALMNMKGGYSFDAYTKEIENLNRQVSEQLASFKAAILEFRTNYEQGSPFAAQAWKLMNGFTDDDTTDDSGTPMGIGDIFLDEATPDETLHRIFLEGNTEAIAAIEQALALACIETGEETVLTRMEDSEYPDELDPEKNAARTALQTAFAAFHSTAVSLQAVAEEIESYEGGADAFFEREELSDEELLTYAVQLSKYSLLVQTPFGNTGMSLFDFAMLDEEAENEDGEVLEDEYLEMLAQSMTDGQLGIVANVGIMTILLNAASAANAQEAEAAFEENGTEQQTISVYFGVDRSLFEDMDSIALTSSALREKAAAEDNHFGEDANADDELWQTLRNAAIASATAGTVAVLFGVKAILEASDVVAGETAAFWFGEHSASITTFDQLYAAANTATISVGGIIATTLGVIAIVAGVVLAIFAILQWLEKPVIPQTKYTRIPRVLVEKPEGQKSFIAYYAAALAGAAEDETDSTKLYGDLNGLNTVDEWVGLYYSKNPTLGAPITTEMLQSASGTLSASEAESYSPIHMFGSTAAANLNQYNTGSGAKAIYVFFRNDASAVAQSGSVFASGTVILSLVTFIVGAGAAAAATYVIMRKRKPQTTAL